MCFPISTGGYVTISVFTEYTEHVRLFAGTVGGQGDMDPWDPALTESSKELSALIDLAGRQYHPSSTSGLTHHFKPPRSLYSPLGGATEQQRGRRGVNSAQEDPLARPGRTSPARAARLGTLPGDPSRDLGMALNYESPGSASSRERGKLPDCSANFSRPLRRRRRGKLSRSGEVEFGGSSERGVDWKSAAWVVPRPPTHVTVTDSGGRSWAKIPANHCHKTSCKCNKNEQYK
ncbi:uncharacterized protein LOC141580694 [Saimiri boliviensis]|uniref:uncharacterized protein LOC141580694 n=1 Tax=Saimiri boliviensis TaxID=27679 RepID=UPI003D783416